MVKNPEILSSNAASLGRFTITMDTLQTDGTPFPYSYVHIKEGAVILAFFRAEIVLIRQYRHAINSWLYELPAGMVSSGEDPLETARRELTEETGFVAANIHSLGWFYPSPGSTTEKIHLFCAECEENIGAHPEASEQIEVMTVAEETFRSMIGNNTFSHGGGIAAYCRYLLLK